MILKVVIYCILIEFFTNMCYYLPFRCLLQILVNRRFDKYLSKDTLLIECVYKLTLLPYLDSISDWCFFSSSSAACLTCLRMSGIFVSVLLSCRIRVSSDRILAVVASNRCFRSATCCLRTLLSNSYFFVEAANASSTSFLVCSSLSHLKRKLSLHCQLASSAYQYAPTMF